MPTVKVALYMFILLPSDAMRLLMQLTFALKRYIRLYIPLPQALLGEQRPLGRNVIRNTFNPVLLAQIKKTRAQRYQGNSPKKEDPIALSVHVHAVA
jgi:hypothetical protein